MLQDDNTERAKVVASFVKSIIASEINDLSLPVFFDGRLINVFNMSQGLQMLF